MPVSVTLIETPPASRRATSRTCPMPVNFRALDKRLNTICLIRDGSPITVAGQSSRSTVKPIALAAACPSNKREASRIVIARSKGVCSSVSLPRSILATSSRSSTSARMVSPAPCITSTRSRCSLARAASASITWVMPNMPFRGVRISWLVVARNSVLTARAFSSWSLVTASSPCAARMRLRLRPSVTNQMPSSANTTIMPATEPIRMKRSVRNCARSNAMLRCRSAAFMRAMRSS